MGQPHVQGDHRQMFGHLLRREPGRRHPAVKEAQVNPQRESRRKVDLEPRAGLVAQPPDDRRRRTLDFREDALETVVRPSRGRHGVVVPDDGCVLDRAAVDLVGPLVIDPDSVAVDAHAKQSLVELRQVVMALRPGHGRSISWRQGRREHVFDASTLLEGRRRHP